MRGSRGEADREQLVGMARENLLRADRMVMGLRDLIGTAGTQPEPELVRVRAIVDEVVSEFTAVSATDEVRIRVLGEFDELLARLMQLTHVFRNLFANAFEHNRNQRDLYVEVGQAESA